MSYYKAPDEALEDPEEMAQWAQKAYDAAVRAAQKKAHKKARKSRGPKAL
jgi:DNA transformation protein